MVELLEEPATAVVQKMTKRVLLVDDDPTIIEAFPVYFSTTDDLKVAWTATTGKQALQWLETNHCDLVLSDIHMPDMNGIELLQHTQQFPQPPLFVAMTAFAADETMLKCLSLGAVGYLIKSQTPESIIHSLHEALHGGTALSSLLRQKPRRTCRQMPRSQKCIRALIVH